MDKKLYLKIKDNLIKEGIAEENDFKVTRRKNNTNEYYINATKVKILLDHSCIINKFGVRLNDLYNEISKLKGHEIIPLQILFHQVIVEENDLCDLCVGTNISIRPQVLFTYSIMTYIKKHRPELSFTIEHNFIKEMLPDICNNLSSGPRVDIHFRDIETIIEFDEEQHENYNSKNNDIERDILIESLQYTILRVSINDNYLEFIHNKFEPIINDKLYAINPKKLCYYVIDKFVVEDYDETLVKLLTFEQCEDIVNNVPKCDRGRTPNKITLTTLKLILHIDDEEYINKIKQHILTVNDLDCESESDCDESDYDEVILPYPYNDIIPYPYKIEDDEIYLSPKLFDYLLTCISSDDYDQVIKFHRLSYDIRDTFMEISYNSNVYNRQLLIKTKKANEIIAKYVQEKNKKDDYNENKQFRKKIEHLEKENELLKKIVKHTNVKKHCTRKKLPTVTNNLIDGEIIIPEYPYLVYSDNKNDYIDSNNLKYYNNIIPLIYKINLKKSEPDLINKIKAKLNRPIMANTTSTLISNCKFIL